MPIKKSERDSDREYYETYCPTIASLRQISTEWCLLIIFELNNGEKRFNELKGRIDVGSRTLSRSLDSLQEHDLIERRTEEDAPIAVYYRLTEKGEALMPVFDELNRWADEWITS